MGLIANAREWLHKATAPPVDSLPPFTPVGPALADMGPIMPTPGIVALARGNTNAALQSAAVWACCRIIANSIATLPVHLYEQGDEGKDLAVNHPLYRMLTVAPNPMMTVDQWLQPTMMNLLLWGNAFCWIDRIGGEVTGLWPLPASRVRMMRLVDGTISYNYTDLAGKPHYYTPGEIIHFRIFTMDGYIGLPVIDYHRMTLDFEAVASQYALNIYQNGGYPTGVLEYPGQLKEQAKENIWASWQKMHGGAGNVGRPAILEEGMKYNALTIPLDQMSYIDEKKFSVEQIARLFGVPPHLIGAMDKPTYASVEQQSIEFVQYTINPYCVTLEHTIRAALLEDPYLFKFNLSGFERGDIGTRYRSYAVARQWGWLSANDVRQLEDMNEIDGGDNYLTPLNMVPAGTEPAEPGVQAQVPAGGVPGGTSEGD